MDEQTSESLDRVRAAAADPHAAWWDTGRAPHDLAAVVAEIDRVEATVREWTEPRVVTVTLHEGVLDDGGSGDGEPVCMTASITGLVEGLHRAGCVIGEEPSGDTLLLPLGVVESVRVHSEARIDQVNLHHEGEGTSDA